MTDDDDLPVLTQVLRVGTLRDASASVGERSAAPLPTARVVDDLLADPLVIGDEPRQAIGAYLAPSIDDATAGEKAVFDRLPEVGDDEAPPRAPDAFRLPQDHDIASTARPSALDVPALGAAVLSPAPGTVEESAAIARRLRDEVVDDLRARIDIELDARIAQALHVEVETVLAQLQQGLRAHLSDALRDVVAKAVDDAIARRVEPGPPTA